MPQQRRLPICFHPEKDLAGKFGELPRELQDLIREYGVPTKEECDRKIAERKLKNIRKQLMEKRENIQHLDTILLQESRIERAAQQIGEYFGMRENKRLLRSMKKWIPSYENRTTDEIADHWERSRIANENMRRIPYRFHNGHNPPEPTDEQREREDRIFDTIQEIRSERGPWQIPEQHLMRAIIGNNLDRGFPWSRFVNYDNTVN